MSVLIHWLSIVIMLAYWAAFYILLIAARENGGYGRRLSMIIWIGHVTVFWTTVVIMRFFFGFVGGSTLITLWSTVIYFHAAFAIFGESLVELRMRYV